MTALRLLEQTFHLASSREPLCAKRLHFFKLRPILVSYRREQPIEFLEKTSSN